MKTATIRELRNAFPKVYRLIQNGESVAITNRRKIVATLTPPIVERAAARSHPWSDLDARLSELSEQPMLPVSGADLVAEDRDRF